MGCTASIVLLQAFRSVVQRSCPHICRRCQEEPSHEVLPLESDEEMSRPRTLVIMVRVICDRADLLMEQFPVEVGL